jgi:hypothetical protein
MFAVTPSRNTRKAWGFALQICCQFAQTLGALFCIAYGAVAVVAKESANYFGLVAMINMKRFAAGRRVRLAYRALSALKLHQQRETVIGYPMHLFSVLDFESFSGLLLGVVSPCIFSAFLSVCAAIVSRPFPALLGILPVTLFSGHTNILPEGLSVCRR